MTQQKENKILALDKEHLRELDGVVMDLESYERHINHVNTPIKTPETTENTDNNVNICTDTPQNVDEHPAPMGVFPCNPVHVGWYEQKTEVSYPVMAGAIQPTCLTTHENVIFYGSYGSYISSGSYVSSYNTSFVSSWFYSSGSFLSSYFYGSGSSLSSYFYGLSGSFSSFKDGFCPAGYGLELI